MEDEKIFPSIFLLSADMWLLSTAIYLVADLEMEKYISLSRDSHASVEKEAYQIAVGSFKAEKLELHWDAVEEDYWVNPDAFLLWCLKKDIYENSTMLEFYKNTVMKEAPFCLAKVIEGDPTSLAKSRKMYASSEAKHRTLALVQLKRKYNPQLTLDQLLADEDVRDIGGWICYKLAQARKWIQEAYPEFKNRVGRPPNNSKR